MKLEILNFDHDEPKRIALKGRDAWALLQLVVAGERGCTPINNPAPRWSAYIFNLRGLGIQIETVHEPHGGAFSGTHGRYVLQSNIRVLENAA